MGQLEVINELRLQHEETSHSKLDQMTETVRKIVALKEPNSMVYLMTNDRRQTIIRFAKLDRMGKTIYSLESRPDSTLTRLQEFENHIKNRIVSQKWDAKYRPINLQQNQSITFSPLKD